MHLYISPVRSDKSTRKTCAASEKGPHNGSIQQGRKGAGAPSSNYRLSFRRRHFMSQSGRSSRPPCRSSAGEDAGSGPSSAAPSSAQPVPSKTATTSRGDRGDMSKSPPQPCSQHPAPRAVPLHRGILPSPYTGDPPPPSPLDGGGGDATPSTAGLRLAPCATHGCYRVHSLANGMGCPGQAGGGVHPPVVNGA